MKPFNIGILRATIANLLANRALLRHRYGNLELNDDTHNTECINCSTDLDWKFIASIKKNVEDNMDNPSFTIDVLCTLLNMSRTSFYNKLKALTDQAPGDYVRLIRLKRAMQLHLDYHCCRYRRIPVRKAALPENQQLKIKQNHPTYR